jgi:hypothetical protein
MTKAPTIIEIKSIIESLRGSLDVPYTSAGIEIKSKFERIHSPLNPNSVPAIIPAIPIITPRRKKIFFTS